MYYTSQSYDYFVLQDNSVCNYARVVAYQLPRVRDTLTGISRLIQIFTLDYRIAGSSISAVRQIIISTALSR